MIIRPTRLFTADGGTSAPPATLAPAPAPAADPLAGLQNLLARASGDATRVLETLYRENYEYRDKLREAQNKIPAEDAVVLRGEKRAAWERYTALGPADAIAAQLAEAAQLKRDRELREVAAAAEVAPAVLAGLAGDLAFVVKDEMKGGKAVKAVYVQPAEGDPIAFETYAQTHWQAFMPALKPVLQPATPGTPSGPSGTGAATPAAVTTDDLIAKKRSGYGGL